jgi:hypothetical protein
VNGFFGGEPLVLFAFVSNQHTHWLRVFNSVGMESYRGCNTFICPSIAILDGQWHRALALGITGLSITPQLTR